MRVYSIPPYGGTFIFHYQFSILHFQNIPNALNKFRHLCYTNSTLIRGGMKNGAF